VTWTDRLLEDAWGSLFIATYILTLFVGAELWSRRSRAPTEWTRKLTHVGAGAVVLAFPWLVQHTISVVMLAFAFAGVLVGGKLSGMLGSIHNVERSTGGAYYYPFAVLFTWVLSGGDALLFCVPLGIMAVADTGAALVGQRAGQTRYRVMDGSRTMEGSMAFFSLAFTVTLVGCSIAERPGWPALLLVTLVVAVLTTSVEAISVRGSDNILIPYAAWLAMERTLTLGLEQLGAWIEGMALGVGLIMATAARAQLSTAGAVTVFLVVTSAWALGGLAWVTPLAALYAMFLMVRPPDLKTDLDEVFPTTAAGMAVLLAYAHTDDPTLYVPFLTSVAASGAIASWLVAEARDWNRPLAAVVGIVVPASAALPWAPEHWPVLLIAAASGLPLFKALDHTPLVGRRFAAALFVSFAAWFWV